MPGILVYSDNLDVALELVTAATKLGKEVSVVLTGNGDLTERAAKVSVTGVSKILEVIDASLKDELTESILDALETVCKKEAPDLVVVGATKRGREIAPRLATRLSLGCVTDCLNLEASSSGFRADRLVWGGNAIATVETKGGAVVTIPVRANEGATGSVSPTIVKVDFVPKPSKIKLLGTKEKPKGQSNIKDAEIVVSAGRGFKKKEDLAIAEELAKVMNAAVGASRPLTSDLGWVPEERQVGLSGTTIKPKLYVAVGISGQIQHLTGMRDSKMIVAINSDKNAPIFQECDYGVVGDLYAVVPELTKILKSQLGR
ncbi:MAG: electron transfer flavoprotein subunit alpha/FixB family protein [Nitrososphaerota archaeon]|nr:electron transfer flavoprotein subunit alpha/FixB family protein [Nitrososphaerota archaeon]